MKPFQALRLNQVQYFLAKFLCDQITAGFINAVLFGVVRVPILDRRFKILADVIIAYVFVLAVELDSGIVTKLMDRVDLRHVKAASRTAKVT